MDGWPFYIPRLFVYHSRAKVNSKNTRRFSHGAKTNEIYYDPVFISYLVIWYFISNKSNLTSTKNELWLNLKFFLFFLMTAFHMYCARIRKTFRKWSKQKI